MPPDAKRGIFFCYRKVHYDRRFLHESTAIPDTAQEKTQTAVVVAVGDDKEKIKVSVGQKVMHDKYAGTQIKIDGEEYLILKAGDIVAVIE